MIIAIEGMDGAGKTTISQHIERTFNFIYVEKPCKYLYENQKGYIDYQKFEKELQYIYKRSPKERSIYFGKGNLIAVNRFKGQNVVLDRHLASNYFWNGDKKLNRYYDALVKECGLPDLTIFLYATPNERYTRLKKRNPKDIDLLDPTVFQDGTFKHIEFFNRYRFNYVMIDTNGKTIGEVCREVDWKIKELIHRKGYKEYERKLQYDCRK